MLAIIGTSVKEDSLLVHVIENMYISLHPSQYNKEKLSVYYKPSHKILVLKNCFSFIYNTSYVRMSLKPEHFF
uniref:Uncharacterized protein n=1 Tax=Rhizophora mucronata TaxID=61149 RepID=A0A2P2QEA0_RHIMU